MLSVWLTKTSEAEIYCLHFFDLKDDSSTSTRPIHFLEVEEGAASRSTGDVSSLVVIMSIRYTGYLSDTKNSLKFQYRQ